MFLTQALFALAFFQAAAPADPTLPPPTAHAELTVIGHGVQIYKCALPNPAAVTFQWVFQEPQADLFDPATHQPVGTHTIGPTWTWHDNSAITGKPLKSQPSPDRANIPWLLLETHSTGGPGTLANIKYVRRSDTKAGAAPDNGCDAQHQDNVIRVPYEATYTFYSAN